ncbi:hypothetical protein HYR54_11110 [Candidatus Acetothermia bacterium]|nr:hypothetical protein [Candidatus Acetothermia bacterium]MBI3460857.1 hypothetical protein [Candidatus Acetothermia bacterium]MBI3660913.1 hypothetical protein [Candidatus Acetothermia bacterium]
MTRIGPGLMGACLGTLLCLLWLVFDWKFLWLFVFALLGYLVGKLFESEELREKLRDLFEAISR